MYQISPVNRAYIMNQMNLASARQQLIVPVTTQVNAIGVIGGGQTSTGFMPKPLDSQVIQTQENQPAVQEKKFSVKTMAIIASILAVCGLAAAAIFGKNLKKG